MKTETQSAIQLDVNKLMSEPITDVFQAVTQLSKSRQEIVDAFYIMASAIENPEHPEYHEKKIKEFLNRYSKEAVI